MKRKKITNKDLLLIKIYTKLKSDKVTVADVNHGIVFVQTYTNIINVFKSNYTKKYSYYYINDNLIFILDFDVIYDLRGDILFDLNEIEKIENLQYTVAYTNTNEYIHFPTKVNVDKNINKLKSKFRFKQISETIKYYFIPIVIFDDYNFYNYRRYYYKVNSAADFDYHFCIILSI